MTIHSEFPLQRFNTFGIHVQAEKFVEVLSPDELIDVFRSNYHPMLILGGGSNILFTKNFNGIVVKIGILGKEIIEETSHEVVIKIGGGESWHSFVEYCVENGYGGTENLALIPGTVGAAPIQNIGAYGVELKDIFESLTIFNTDTYEFMTLSAAECNFGYRDSIFKHELRGKAVITSVCLRLEKSTVARHTSYKDVVEELENNNITKPTIKDVFTAVCAVRSRKLPNPAEIGNAGSFFKNPTISSAQFSQLQLQFPDIPHYQQPNSHEKIPAAWLIQQCGWKGIRRGETGVHANQALVLVNYGFATGAEIIALAREIQTSVYEKFAIMLEMEVNII